MLIRSDRLYTFDRDADAVWNAVSDTSKYPGWWPWLRRFDGTTLAAGEVWTCEVRPPQPYPGGLVVSISLERIEPARLLSARVSGDVRGTASLEITPGLAGCQIRLVSELSPTKRLLRIAGFLAPPVMRAGHSRVMDAAARQFASAALGTHAQTPSSMSGASPLRLLPRSIPGPGIAAHPSSRRK